MNSASVSEKGGADEPLGSLERLFSAAESDAMASKVGDHMATS